MNSQVNVVGRAKPMMAAVVTLSMFSATLAGCGGASPLEASVAPLSQSTPVDSSQVLPAEEGRLVGYYDNGVWIAPPTGIDASIGEPVALTRGEGNDPVDYANAQIGDKYLYGATGPNQWDCSGLTQAAYKVVKVNLPRTAADQSKVGTQISRSSLKRGDLVFFDCAVSDPKKKKTATHVGIMLDNRYMIDANSVAGKVVKDDLNVKYWSDRLLHGRRVR